MDVFNKEKKNKSLIRKAWERCRSISAGAKRSTSRISFSKSKSWHPTRDTYQEDGRVSPAGPVAPEGCFSVYVGPEKQRFVVKAKYANHPLFKMLLEEAELEYGYNSEGPLALPCNVDLFYKVLSEMDDEGEEIRHGCNCAKGYASYRLLSPSRTMAMN